MAEAHGWLLEIARRLEPDWIDPTIKPPIEPPVERTVAQRADEIADPRQGAAEPEATRPAPSGAEVRRRVESYLAEIRGKLDAHLIPEWLEQPVGHLEAVFLRLGEGLYHCYDVDGLPRTNNDLEQFYRRLKTSERRTTGHRRSDNFVVRVGGLAVYAVAESGVSEGELVRRLAEVPAARWREERAILWANQERQVKMRRFRLHTDAYLANLETRWSQLANSP